MGAGSRLWPARGQLYQEKQAGQPASSDIYISTAVQISPYVEKDLFRRSTGSG